MSGSTLATAVEQLYIPVHAEGITMSMDDIVAVDSHSRLVLEPFKRPEVTEAMTAHNSAEQEGRATAMALATMAANYFVHEANPGRVLEARQGQGGFANCHAQSTRRSSEVPRYRYFLAIASSS